MANTADIHLIPANFRLLDTIKRVPTKVWELLSGVRDVNEPGNSLLIETVSACNAKCTFCTMQAEQKIASARMPLAKFQQIIRENADFIKKTYNGVEPYYRGEALLHNDFWEICKTLDQYGIRNMGINSNLSLRKIALERFTEFRIPLIVNMGGATKEVHESVMKGSDYDMVVSNIRRLIELGVEFQVKINPTRKNLHELDLLANLLEKLGGKREQVLVYSTCYPIPATASQAEKDTFFRENISPEMDPHLRFTYDLSKPGYDIKAKKSGCNFLVDTIFYDGQMTMCCHDQLQTVNIGNVFEQKLEVLRASEKYKEAIQKAKRLEHAMCPGCN